MFSAENRVINKLTEVVKLYPADGENSRCSRLVLSSVTLRAAAELLPETSGEVGHISVADMPADLAHRHLRAGQEFFCLLHTHIPDILFDILSRLFFKYHAQISG